MDSDDYGEEWGEDPLWLQEQRAADAAAAQTNNDEDWTASSSFDAATDVHATGAQHLLLLLDCSRPSMWTPSISILNNNHNATTTTSSSEDEEAEDESDRAMEESSVLISPLDAALTVAERFMRHKVLQVATMHTGKRDGVGVLLYGTSKQKRRMIQTEHSANHDSDEDSEEEDDSDTPNTTTTTTTTTHTLLPLDPPGIPHIKSLRACLPSSNVRRNNARRRDLQEEFGLVQQQDNETAVIHPLRSALREAVDEYWNAKCVNHRPTKDRPADTKSIWFVTDNDDPCKGNEQEVKLLERAAKDVMENGIAIHVLPILGQGRMKFRRNVFWDRIVSTNSTIHSAAQPPALDAMNANHSAVDLDDLVQNIQAQWAQVRKQFSLPLMLPDWKDRPDGPHIMLDLFRPVSVRQKPVRKYEVHQETKKETIKTTQTISRDMGDIIPKREKGATNQPGDLIVVKYAEFGGERVYLKPAEVLQIKNESNATDKVSLILLGFRDANSIPLHFVLDRSFFLFPNDELVKGSTAAFANLHAAMLRKKVLAIAEFRPRITSTSRLVALYPQQEESEVQEDGSTSQSSPPGLILIELPFETEIRDFSADDGAIDAPSEESVTAAIDLMRKLRLKDYAPGERFENHALTQFWNYIEAVALDTRVMPFEEYEPLMDDEQILEVAGPRIAAFARSLPDDLVPEQTRKRKTLKVEDDTGFEWEELYRTGAIGDCTIAELKQFLRSRGQRVSGKKEELLLRIEQCIRNRIREKQTENDLSES